MGKKIITILRIFFFFFFFFFFFWLKWPYEFKQIFIEHFIAGPITTKDENNLINQNK